MSNLFELIGSIGINQPCPDMSEEIAARYGLSRADAKAALISLRTPKVNGAAFSISRPSSK